MHAPGCWANGFEKRFFQSAVNVFGFGKFPSLVQPFLDLGQARKNFAAVHARDNILPGQHFHVGQGRFHVEGCQPVVKGQGCNKRR
jgi:hypothetical protein